MCFVSLPPPRVNPWSLVCSEFPEQHLTPEVGSMHAGLTIARMVKVMDSGASQLQEGTTPFVLFHPGWGQQGLHLLGVY